MQVPPSGHAGMASRRTRSAKRRSEESSDAGAEGCCRELACSTGRLNAPPVVQLRACPELLLSLASCPWLAERSSASLASEPSQGSRHPAFRSAGSR